MGGVGLGTCGRHVDAAAHLRVRWPSPCPGKGGERGGRGRSYNIVANDRRCGAASHRCLTHPGKGGERGGRGRSPANGRCARAA